jgi:pseudouridine-5'-monophosphatase
MALLQSMKNDQVRCVIFDLDGLLINSENFYEAADKVVLQALGKAYSVDLEWKLRGRSALDCANRIVDFYRIDMSPEDWLQTVTEEQEKMFPSTRPMPGMIKILHHLNKHNIPLAIATSSTFKVVAKKTDHLQGMIAYFRHIVSISDPEVRVGKPHPDVYLVAKNRFKEGSEIPPIECLVFEDAVNGIKAATKAGMSSVFIPDPKMPVEVALSCQPTLTIRTGHDFKPELFGLPKYDYRPVTHVLFDVDGLILDTGAFFNRVTKQLLARHDKQLDWEQKVELMGKRRADMIEDMIEMLELPMTNEELNKEYSNLVEPMNKSAKMIEGAARLIKHLHAKGVPIAVATSSSAETLEVKMTNHKDVYKLFNHVVTGSHPDLKDGKPAPDIFLLSASNFPDKPKPENCLVFEDAPNGVQAAYDAGMQSVMVPHTNLGPLYTKKATQVLHSLIDFKPEDFGLPPFQN